MSNLIKAIEKAEEELGESLSYHTDDNGKVTQIFVWRAPGLKFYLTGIDRRASIDSLTSEIVEVFEKMMAPRPVGRPRLDVKRIAITLTPELRKKAEKIGNGNVSDGIRKALAAWASSATSAPINR